MSFVIRAFLNGMDGVFIGACRLNECNYITHGNYHALSVTHLCKKLLERIGLNPERLRIEFMSAGDGILFTEVINDFGKKIKEVGPLGKSEGIERDELTSRLEAVNQLLPYIKLVERERLRIPITSEKAYREFFTSEEFERLFDDLIVDKLAMSQIMLLLRREPLSTGEIAKMSGLSPSEVSRHMSVSSRQGLVRYDESKKCFALAQ